MAGIAWLTISGELLRDMLHMPRDCVVYGSSEADDTTVRVLVEHESIDRDAIEVTAHYRSVHGVSFFDRFQVTKRRAPADAARV